MVLFPRSENGRQAGGGAAGVQVTQGPRHPAGPPDRQTGGAGVQGGAVKERPLKIRPGRAGRCPPW